MLNQAKFEKMLTRVVKKNEERCSMCKRPFNESCHTFGGLDMNNKVQIVGRCCADLLLSIHYGGLFISVPVDSEQGKQQAKALLASHPVRRYMKQ